MKTNKTLGEDQLGIEQMIAGGKHCCELSVKLLTHVYQMNKSNQHGTTLQLL